MDEKQIALDKAKGIKFAGTVLQRYPEDLQDESYMIPEGITEIAPRAFADCRNLKNVTFPSTLQCIQQEAFHNCGIKKAVLPEGLTELEPGAFICCDLEEVILPNSLNNIGNHAFFGCGELRKLVTSWEKLPGTFMEYSAFVFKDCSKLLNVTGCNRLKALAAEYQHRACHPLPEDHNPDFGRFCWLDEDDEFSDDDYDDDEFSDDDDGDEFHDDDDDKD